MRFRTLCLALVVVTIVLALPGAASATVASQFRVAIGSEASFPNLAQAAQHNSYIVLQAWEAKRATELKAANPSLKVLVYQNLSAMAQSVGPGGLSSSGVNYGEANTAHPDWFLLNTSGGRIAESGYSWLWMADTANAGYQQQWTDNVLKLLAGGPWDGVMMDDTNTTARYHTEPSSIAKYPTDAAYQGMIRSILAYAGPRIQTAGKLAVPNMGSWNQYPEVVEEWLHYVNGGIDEMFAKWSAVPGQGYRDPSGWQTQIEEIQSTERMGKTFLAITQAEPTDTQAIRYGWASVLLGANGHTAYSAAANYNTESWSSEYETNIGEPTSVATKIAGGAWWRAFTGGLVLVNPTTSTIAVSLGGTYSGSGLSNATSTTMAPDSALILQRVANEESSGSTGSTTTASSPSGSTTSGSTTEGSTTTLSSSSGSTSSGSTSTGSGSSASTPAGSTTGGSTTTESGTSAHHKKPTTRRGGKTSPKATVAVAHVRGAKCIVALKARGRSRRAGAAKHRRGSHTTLRTRRACARSNTRV